MLHYVTYAYEVLITLLYTPILQVKCSIGEIECTVSNAYSISQFDMIDHTVTTHHITICHYLNQFLLPLTAYREKVKVLVKNMNDMRKQARAHIARLRHVYALSQGE